MKNNQSNLVKHSKATYYKHRLERAVDLLKEIRGLEAETPHGLEDDLNEIKWKIDYLLEDITNE